MQTSKKLFQEDFCFIIIYYEFMYSPVGPGKFLVSCMLNKKSAFAAFACDISHTKISIL